ncbi:MAG TPA: DUF551 domain-containing protein [Noviherbaspirillum sp.]
MNTTEQITWIPVAQRLPDSDTTVMLFDADANEPVWLGYFGGERWHYVDGMPATPSDWAEMPAGPAS